MSKWLLSLHWRIFHISTLCFSVTHKLRMVFTFLGGCTKSKEDVVIRGHYIKFKFLGPQIKFYWSTVIILTGSLVCSCFPITTGQSHFSSGQPPGGHCLTRYSPDLYSRGFRTPCCRAQSTESAHRQGHSPWCRQNWPRAYSFPPGSFPPSLGHSVQ